MNENLTEWVIKVGNWEYDPDKPKKRWDDFDYTAEMLVKIFKVSPSLIEAYLDLIIFAYIDKNPDVIKLDVDKVRRFINTNGGVEKIINSFSKN